MTLHNQTGILIDQRQANTRLGNNRFGMHQNTVGVEQVRVVPQWVVAIALAVEVN